jgi:hypothetical protein
MKSHSVVLFLLLLFLHPVNIEVMESSLEQQSKLGVNKIN